ncbi:MAG TPA: hypothetical protein VG319_05940, partial [Polyangia bacterium]|nr:hypothetical protein [Polyangia bacterium]
GRDTVAGRITPVVVGHETHVYVTETEAKTLDTAQTYFTFGWPFVILGVLLAAASRERRPSFVPMESDSPWTERR